MPIGYSNQHQRTPKPIPTEIKQQKWKEAANRFTQLRRDHRSKKRQDVNDVLELTIKAAIAASVTTVDPRLGVLTAGLLFAKEIGAAASGRATGDQANMFARKKAAEMQARDRKEAPLNNESAHPLNS